MAAISSLGFARRCGQTHTLTLPPGQLPACHPKPSSPRSALEEALTAKLSSCCRDSRARSVRSMWWKRSPFRTAACSSAILSAPEHGSRPPTALLGAVFFGRCGRSNANDRSHSSLASRVTAFCWGCLLGRAAWVTCSSCSVRCRSAEALVRRALPAASRRLGLHLTGRYFPAGLHLATSQRDCIRLPQLCLSGSPTRSEHHHERSRRKPFDWQPHPDQGRKAEDDEVRTTMELAREAIEASGAEIERARRLLRETEKLAAVVSDQRPQAMRPEKAEDVDC